MSQEDKLKRAEGQARDKTKREVAERFGDGGPGGGGTPQTSQNQNGIDPLAEGSAEGLSGEIQ